MGEFFTSLVGSLLKQVFTKGISKMWDNKGFLLLYYKTLLGSHRKKRIRFSISYLFRIRIPDSNSYLLVMNRRISNQLQPVGGSYKRYGDDKIFESWGHLRDNNKNGLGTDAQSENDLRFTVEGKYVIQVIKWFEEGKERECSADREFREELIDTNILDKKLFEKIRYRHLKRHSKHLKWSDHHQCFEVLIYDIFELLPTEEQKDALRKLKNEPLEIARGYAIVECDDIEQLRLVRNGYQVAKIGEHTRLITNNKI